MQNSFLRALVLAVAMSGALAVAAPRADACGPYVTTEEDKVWSAAYAYLHDVQSFGGDARLEAVELLSDQVATARWAEPKGTSVTHAVLMKLEGRWHVIGTRRVAQASSSSSSSSSPPSSTASKR
jgi:hypothetical protein